MTLFSLIGRHDMGALMVAWEFRDSIKTHKIFFDDGLDEYEQTAIINMFTRLYESGDIDFSTSVRRVNDENLSDLLEIERQIKESMESNEVVYINTTETLGTASAWLGARLLGLGVKFVSYNPNEHEITALDNKSLTTREADRSMGVERLFWLRGFNIEVEKDRDYLTKNKTHLAKLFEKPKKYLEIAAELQGSHIYPYKKELFDELAALSIIDDNGSLISSKTRLDGGMFEEYVGSLLSEMEFDDVVCGAKVFWGGEGNNFSNEFDALCLHKNTIFVVECKMRSSINEEELLYKYDALRRYAAPSSKAMVVHLGKKGILEQVSDKLYRRFGFAGIGLYGAKKISEDGFKNFVNKLFFAPHPSHLLWVDSQAASSQVFIEINNDIYTPSDAQSTKPNIRTPQTQNRGLPSGLMYVAEQKLPPLLADAAKNPLVYYYLAMPKLLKQLAGWSHQGLAYSGYREHIWQSIVDGDYSRCGWELVEAVQNLEYDDTFRQLREIARLYFTYGANERDKNNESFVALVLSVRAIYEKLRGL